MFILRIEYYDGRDEVYYCDSKEEVEEAVESLWTLEADFLVAKRPDLFYIFWEDRYDFNW